MAPLKELRRNPGLIEFSSSDWVLLGVAQTEIGMGPDSDRLELCVIFVSNFRS